MKRKDSYKREKIEDSKHVINLVATQADCRGLPKFGGMNCYELIVD